MPLLQLCCELKSKEVSQSFKRVVTKKDNIQTHGGMSQASAVGKWCSWLPCLLSCYTKHVWRVYHQIIHVWLPCLLACYTKHVSRVYYQKIHVCDVYSKIASRHKKYIVLVWISDWVNIIITIIIINLRFWCYVGY